jgi:hypothetical protein
MRRRALRGGSGAWGVGEGTAGADCGTGGAGVGACASKTVAPVAQTISANFGRRLRDTEIRIAENAQGLTNGRSVRFPRIVLLLLCPVSLNFEAQSVKHTGGEKVARARKATLVEVR